mgnify:FL=1
MIFLLAGSSHTGKTLLAQKLLERYALPYLSIDHLKMGLIRSGQIPLTPEDDDRLTVCLWPILREIIKTAIENRQNLVLEGCYIPFTWREDFSAEYLAEIRYCCLIMTEDYIRGHFDVIRKYAGAIETRLDDSLLTPESLIADNRFHLAQCRKHGLPYYEISGTYTVRTEVIAEKLGLDKAAAPKEKRRNET